MHMSAPTRCTATRPTRSRSWNSRRAGTTPTPPTRTASPRLSDRPVQALALRRVQGRGRRHGAGVRPLLRHAHLLPARRLPDRAEPQRRRAARLPQLPREVQPRRARIPGLRLQGQAGARQHPLADVARFMDEFFDAPRVAEVYNLGGGKANSCSILEAFEMAEEITGKKQVYDLRRPEPRRRPHLLLQRPAQDAGALPGLGHQQAAWPDLRGDRRAWQQRLPVNACMRILISGVCGFVGSTLADWLARHRAAGLAASSGWTTYRVRGRRPIRLRLRTARRRLLSRRPALAPATSSDLPAGRLGHRCRGQSERAGRRRRPDQQPPADRAQPGRHGQHARVLQASTGAGFILLAPAASTPSRRSPRMPVESDGETRSDSDAGAAAARGLSPQTASTRTSPRPRPSRSTAPPSSPPRSSPSNTARRSVSRSGSTAAACWPARDSSARADQGIFAYWINALAAAPAAEVPRLRRPGHQVRDCLHPRDLVPLLVDQMRTAPPRWPPRRERRRRPRQRHVARATQRLVRRHRFGRHARSVDPRHRARSTSLDRARPRQGRDGSAGSRRHRLHTILEEIAAMREQHPDWLDMFGA